MTLTRTSSTEIHASEIPGVVLDCDIKAGTKIGGGTPTDNTASINAVLALATATNHVKIIIDGGAAVKSLIIPDTGCVTIQGLGHRTGFFALGGTNGSVIHTTTFPWVPGSPESVAGGNLVFRDLFINANRSGNSTSGDPRGAGPSGPWYCGFNLHAQQDVTFDNVYIYDSPSFGAVLYACHDVKVIGGGVESPGRSSNTDGYHFDGGCSNVNIDGTYFATGDDAIALNMDEGEGTAGSNFTISNPKFDDCAAALRVYGRAVSTKNVIMNGATGTVRGWLLTVGDDVVSPSPVAECNQSITLSDMNVGFTGGAYTPIGLILLNGSAGSIVINNLQMNSSAYAVPIFTDNATGGNGCVISSLDLNNCKIYRNSVGNAASYIINMVNSSTIKNLNVSNFKFVNQVSGSYTAVSNLINITSPAAITRLFMHGLDLDGVTNKFGGSGTFGTVVDLDAPIASVAANLIYAGPVSGSPALPSFRTVVSADLPLASSSVFGISKVDGTSITASAGVISSIGGGGGGGVETLLSTLTASSSASLEFVITTGYSRHKLRITDILPATNGANLILEFSNNSGSSYFSSSYQWTNVISTYAGTLPETFSGGDSSIRLAASVLNTVDGVSMDVDLFNLQSSVYPSVSADGSFFSSAYSNACCKIIGSGAYFGSLTAINKVRVRYSTGNIASGTISSYSIVS